MEKSSRFLYFLSFSSVFPSENNLGGRSVISLTFNLEWLSLYAVYFRAPLLITLFSCVHSVWGSQMWQRLEFVGVFDGDVNAFLLCREGKKLL